MVHSAGSEGFPDSVSCVVLSLVVGLLLIAPASGRPFSEERLLLDRRLETLRRILPDGHTESADTGHIQGLARRAGLGQLEITPGAPVESASQGEGVYELVALGGYEEIDRFFGQVAVSHRLVDVEKLTMATAADRVIKLETTLRLPFWPSSARLPSPPETSRKVSGVPRPTVEAYRRDQAVALGKSSAIETWRRARRNPRLFLSELAAIVQDRPVVVGFASVGDGFTVRGLAVGEGTMQGLESRFERGFFRVSQFLMVKQGACHRFEVHGQSPVVGPEAEISVPIDDPFVQDEAPCQLDRDPASRIVVRGAMPTAKKPGNGPLTLRLRDMDLADVFQALNLVSGAGFVVDSDVVGRVSLDVTRMTLAEILKLLRDEVKIAIQEDGPVRRVSRVGQETRAPTATGGDAVSFSLKRAEVRELLAVMTEIDSSLASLGPDGFLGRLSVWASGVPLLDLRAAVLDAVGLVETLESDQRVLSRDTGSGQPPVPVAWSAPERRLTLRPDELALLEFDLAGVAAGGERWMAFAYSPTGQLHSYRRGERLGDAVVVSIQSTDVVLETSEGPLRVTLPSLGQ